jgi:hypothetical protein
MFMDYFVYFLISVLTFLSLSTIIGYMSKKFSQNNDDFIRYSQSHIHNIIKDYIPKPTRLAISKSQSLNHETKQHVKVIITEDKAYWIMNNNFYSANVVEGSIDKDSTSVVDTFSLDQEELDKMLFILDQLKNGS